MLCQKCNQREAAIHFTKIINNSKVEMYLCQQCAKEEGLKINYITIDMGSFFAGLMGAQEHANTQNTRQDDLCPVCSMSFAEFMHKGKMGCPFCYEAFGERIKPLLKRIHGNVEHTGKVPEKYKNTIQISRRVNQLKKELEEAVKKEEYEKAATIRDKIKDVEMSGGEGDNGKLV